MAETDLAIEYDRAVRAAAVFDLSARGRIELTGADAASFLHNLSTNDIVNLAAGAGCEAFLTTAKARIVAHLLTFRTPKALWLDTAGDQVQTILKHLDFYRISEQVEFADRTGDWSQFHLCGPSVPDVLARMLGQAPAQLGALEHEVCYLQSQPLPIRRHDWLSLPGYDLLCPKASAANLHSALVAAGATPASASTWEVLRVEAGWPVFGRDMDENRFVVEVGRMAQAICYTKGCYLGQEPIVMARDRGHVNRTLLGLALSGAEPPAPGARVFQTDQEVGQVTSSTVSPRFGAIALAYLRRGSQEPGTALEVETASDRVGATVRPLPLSL